MYLPALFSLSPSPHNILCLPSIFSSLLQLWEVYHDRRCLRTFIGHAKAVRAIDFSYDGTKFLSCSYDRHIKLWDTETGESGIGEASYRMHLSAMCSYVYLTGDPLPYHLSRFLILLLSGFDRQVHIEIHQQQNSILCPVQS